MRALPDYFDVVGVAESDPDWYNARHELGAYAGLPFMTEEEIFAIVDDLVKMGAKNIAISSCIADGQDCIAIYDHSKKSKQLLPYERIPVKIGGTGDVFSAMIMADVMNGIDFAAVGLRLRCERHC